MPGLTPANAAEAREWDEETYIGACLKIVNKHGKLVKFKPNIGQLALLSKLNEQRRSGKPMRVVILKARQVGFSTLVQGLLIQRCTLDENHSALVVAHNRETGGKLFTMGQRMYANLPDEVKPEVRSFGRARFLHFAQRGADAIAESLWPDSTYTVDTAEERESGRGGTYRSLHLSELAFWPDIETKLVALLQAVPDDPDSLVAIESTANGHNQFKDEWDKAAAGDSDYIPFFWPWWKEPTYKLPFQNPAEKESFRLGDIDQSPYAEEEPELVAKFKLTPEQLHWRRKTIANKTKSLEKFKQEYPATPEEAFIASGRQVFDPEIIKGILVKCNLTDPRDKRTPEGPIQGTFKAGSTSLREGRAGRIEVPENPLWVPRTANTVGPQFRLWLPDEVMTKTDKPDITGQYIIASDVSAGQMSDGASEADYHAVQVIDHKTREQVAQYRSHIDPDLLAELIYLAALYFNKAWVAVEVTGSHGLPVARKIFFDYRYPFIYTRKQHESQHERQEDRIGWDTNRRTKPILESNAQELLREGIHGVKSRDLAREMLTYVKDDRGRTGAEPGKYDDLLIAWMIAQQVANELPIKLDKKKRPTVRKWMY